MAVFTSIGVALASTTFLSAVTQLVVGVALNLVTQELFGPDEDDPQRAGIVGTMQLGADVPRSFTVGRYATAGSLVYHNHWGYTSSSNGVGLDPLNPLDPPTYEINNDYYTRVTALSDAPIHALNALVLDGTYTQIDWANPDTELGRGYPLLEFSIDKEWAQAVVTNPSGGGPESNIITGYTTTTHQIVRGWVKFHDGTQTTADQFLIDYVATDERPWGADCVGKGVAYAVVTLRYDEELFKRLPEIKYVVDGIACHDPRDAQDKSGTRNPILQMREIVNGITVEGQWLYGCQRPVALDDAELGAQATLCGLNPPGWEALTDQEKTDIWGHTGPIGRYLCGAEILVNEPIADALERLAMSCNGVFADAGAHMRVLVGEDVTASFTVTDGDFRSTAEQGFDPFPPLAEAVNAITATYPSPADLWEVQDAPPLYNAAFELEDDSRRLVRNVDLNTVPWPEQVERLMAAAMAEARRARSNTGTLPASYWGIEAGDYVTFTSARNGYTDKLFRVAAAVHLGNGDVSVVLTEMDPDAYDWSPAVDYVPAQSLPPVKQPLPPVVITDFTVSPSWAQDAAGTPRRPAILLEWDHPDVAHVISGIRWQVRVAATGVPVADGATADLQAQAHKIADVLPATAYEVRVKWQSARPSTWSAYKPVTTPDIRIDTVDLADPVNTKIDDAALDAIQGIADAAAVQSELDALTDGFTGGTLEGEFDQVRTELSLDSAQLLPESFAEDGRFWTSSFDVAPENSAALSGLVTFETSATYGRLAVIDASTAANIFVNTLGTAKMVPGRRYRIEVEARLVAADAAGGPHLGTQFRGQASDYSYVKHAGAVHTFAAANAFEVFTHELTFPSDGSWNGVDHIRFVTYKTSGYAVASAEIELRRITISDVTETDALSGDIIDILGLNIGPTYAFGVMLQELEVDAGGNSAFVSTTLSALADMDGFSAAFAGVTAETSGGHIAGFKATSWTDPDGTGGAVLQLLGDVVVEQSLAVSKLIVTDLQNFAAGSDFEDNTPGPWVLEGAGWYVLDSFGHNGTHSLHTGTGTLGVDRKARLGNIIDVTPGDQLHFSYWVFVGAAFNGDADSKLRLGNALSSNAHLHSQAYNGLTANIWNEVSFNYTVPSGVHRIQVELWANNSAGGAIFDDIVIRRRFGGELVVDGSITAAKLDVDELSAITADFGEATFTGSVKSGVLIGGEPAVSIDFNTGEAAFRNVTELDPAVISDTEKDIYLARTVTQTETTMAIITVTPQLGELWRVQYDGERCRKVTGGGWYGAKCRVLYRYTIPPSGGGAGMVSTWQELRVVDSTPPDYPNWWPFSGGFEVPSAVSSVQIKIVAKIDGTDPSPPASDGSILRNVALVAQRIIGP